MIKKIQARLLFWKKIPALAGGLLFLLGTLCAFGKIWALLPGLLLFFSLPSPFIALLFFLPVAWIPFHHSLPLHGTQGEGLFIIHSEQKVRGGWLYKGTLKTFVSPEASQQAKNVPCRIFSRHAQNLDAHYVLQGIIKEKNSLSFSLKTTKAWEPIPSSNIIKIRQKAKRWCGEKIKKEGHEKSRAGSFLTALLTGELDDQELARDLNQYGLTHLLAISGFHFAWLTAFFIFFLPSSLSYRQRAILSLIFISFYFLFIGNTPSVQRAWITLLIFFSGHLFERPSYALNNLGVALFIQVALSPFQVFHLGFQLSFTATAGLLLFSATKQPPLEEPYSLLQLHLRPLVVGLKKILVLTAAVHLACFPLLLLHFHRFSWQSLLYNLFFPLLIPPAMILLILGITTSLIVPPLSKILLQSAIFYTDKILLLLERLPLPKLTTYVENFSAGLFTIIFTGIIAFGLWKQTKKETLLSS